MNKTRRDICFLLALGVLATMALPSCARRAGPRDTAMKDSAALYAKAQNSADRGEWSDVLASLSAALENGFHPPMRIVIDPRLAGLVADPESRPRVRKLLSEHARESDAVMARNDEPGKRLIVQGTLVDETNGKPVPGALVELVHADANGQYFNSGEPIVGESAWNPRLFAYLQSARDGAFGARTVRPGSYNNDAGDAVPAHLHFSILAEGYRPFHGEFLLGDDPLVPERGREGVSERGTLIADVRDKGGVAVCRVTIPLQPQ